MIFERCNVQETYKYKKKIIDLYSIEKFLPKKWRRKNSAEKLAIKAKNTNISSRNRNKTFLKVQRSSVYKHFNISDGSVPHLNFILEILNYKNE